MTVRMKVAAYEDRVAEWERVFPRVDGYQSVNAEWLTLLELALEDLRGRGQPLREPDSGLLATRAAELLDVVGDFDGGATSDAPAGGG